MTGGSQNFNPISDASRKRSTVHVSDPYETGELAALPEHLAPSVTMTALVHLRHGRNFPDNNDDVDALCLSALV